MEFYVSFSFNLFKRRYNCAVHHSYSLTKERLPFDGQPPPEVIKSAEEIKVLLNPLAGKDVDTQGVLTVMEEYFNGPKPKKN